MSHWCKGVHISLYMRTSNHIFGVGKSSIPTKPKKRNINNIMVDSLPSTPAASSQHTVWKAIFHRSASE